ncbi:MAG: aminotransferase class V-fold PLP-dependent enzyme [Alphaproteobacteria bacterium]
MPISREDCLAEDRGDPLAAIGDRFIRSAGTGDRSRIYMDANSIGAPPRDVAERLRRTVEDNWGMARRRSWGEAGWLEAAATLGDGIAAIVGAAPGEIVVADSTTINLFKAVVGALQLRNERRKVVSEAVNFPTDLYATQAAIDLLGKVHTLALATDGSDSDDDICALIDADTAVVVLSLVDYRTSRRRNLAKINAAAHAAGALTVWDLSHGAGAVPIDLNGTQTDFAVSCTYKYLCGGPGAPAFFFAAKRHNDGLDLGLKGWLGHADQFAFELGYRPADGAKRALIGTPPVLSTVGLQAAMAIWADVDPTAAARKHGKLSTLLLDLTDQELVPLGVAIASPRDYDARGGHIALRHPGGNALVEALAEADVICSFRTPDSIRFGVSPLTTRYVDIWDALARFRAALENNTWRDPRFAGRTSI